MKKYHKYKWVNLEWLNELPDSWNVIQIKHLRSGEGTMFIDGDWIESDVIVDDGIRYLTTGNIGAGAYKEQGLRFITEQTFKDLNCTEVLPGDLVISRLNEPIGRACIVPDLGYKIITAVDNVILRPKAPFDKKYLMYLMNSSEYAAYTSLIARGATMKRISRGQLGNIKIPFPTENEQTQIAFYLDYQCARIDNLVEKKEKLVELLKKKRQAIIIEAVTKGLNLKAKMKYSGAEWLGEMPEGWRACKLKWLANIYAGGTPNTSIDKYWTDGTVPWLNSGTVNQKRIRTASEFITEEAVSNSSAKWVPKNSLVMALAGQGKTKGTVAILEIDATCNQSMAAIVPDRTIILTEFLFYFLHASYSRIRGLAGSEQRDGLNLEIIGDIFCPLPKLEEQKEIVTYLNDIDSMVDFMIEKLVLQIEKIREYRQSIVSEAVTGKVDVRDWQSPT